MPEVNIFIAAAPIAALLALVLALAARRRRRARQQPGAGDVAVVTAEPVIAEPVIAEPVTAEPTALVPPAAPPRPAGPSLLAESAGPGREALYDALTGLPNRALVVDRLEHALRRASRNGTSVGVLCLRLEAPAAHGESVRRAPPDSMVVAAAGRLTHCLRGSDTVGRFGGGELIVVCEDLISADQAMGVAERVQASMSLTLEGDEETVALEVSVGVVFGGGTSPPEELLRDADAAMYHARDKGRGCHAFFDATVRDSDRSRQEMETGLEGALARGEGLRVSYQPEVEVHTGRVVGVEAMCHWDHPTLGRIEHEYLALMAEQTGLAVPLGRFVLEEACRQAAAWAAAGLDLRVSARLSPRQLLGSDVAGTVVDVLCRSGLAADSLCLKVAESALAGDDSQLALALWHLKSTGVRLGVTDFGSSYSSLAHLRRFPLDEVEVDRAFVTDLGHEAQAAPPVQAIVSAVHSLGLVVGAAGVERPEQLQALSRLGFQRARGRHFSAAVTPAELARFIVEGPGRIPNGPLSTGHPGDLAA
jgi:diguanylate cyclase (GGDEF)-like protein